MLCLLGGLDDGRLIEVALVVDIELAEGVLQAKDLALVELGVLSVRNGCQALWNLGDLRGSLPLELNDVHGCGGVGEMAEDRKTGLEMVAEATTAKVTAWLSLVLRCAFDVCVLLVLLSLCPDDAVGHLPRWARLGGEGQARLGTPALTQYAPLHIGMALQTDRCQAVCWLKSDASRALHLHVYAGCKVAFWSLEHHH